MVLRGWAQWALALAVGSAGPVSASENGVEGLWGHLRYHETRELQDAAAAYPWDAPEPETVWCRVHGDVLPPLRALLAEANRAGYRLIAHSCYRSVDRQVDVFFGGLKGAGAESAAALRGRALSSAPPGFSEHHTGFAIDFCDGQVPETCDSFDADFATTPAGAWLIAHGSAYGFEMSFPDHSSACVLNSDRPARPMKYEPWHWRFVASPAAAAVFAKARERFPVCPVAAAPPAQSAAVPNGDAAVPAFASPAGAFEATGGWPDQ